MEVSWPSSLFNPPSTQPTKPIKIGARMRFAGVEDFSWVLGPFELLQQMGVCGPQIRLRHWENCYWRSGSRAPHAQLSTRERQRSPIFLTRPLRWHIGKNSVKAPGTRMLIHLLTENWPIESTGGTGSPVSPTVTVWCGHEHQRDTTQTVASVTAVFPDDSSSTWWSFLKENAGESPPCFHNTQNTAISFHLRWLKQTSQKRGKVPQEDRASKSMEVWQIVLYGLSGSSPSFSSISLGPEYVSWQSSIISMTQYLTERLFYQWSVYIQACVSTVSGSSMLEEMGLLQ